MKFKVLAGVAALALSAGTAFAADSAPSASWTGFSIGIGGGGAYALSNVSGYGVDATDADGGDEYLPGCDVNGCDEQALFDAIEDGDATGIASGVDADTGAAGYFGTVEAGFDVELGSSVVLGIVGNYDLSSTTSADVETGSAVYTGGVPVDFYGQANLETGDSFGIGGRVGVLANEDTLLYGVAGYSQLDAKLSSEAWVDESLESESVISDSEWVQGFFVGGGIESRLTDSISAKVEYRFARYNGLSADNRDGCDGDCTNEDNYFAYHVESDDIDVHSVRATISYKFGL